MDLAAKDDSLKIRLKLGEHQFLWANISQRSRNTWMAGAFFVPVSFLIFAYAVTAKDLSRLDFVLILLASMFSYSAWMIVLFRTEAANKIYIDRMKSIEKELTELKELKEIDVKFLPLIETDERRKGWLEYGFPRYVWEILWGLLLLLWLLLSTEIW